MGSEREPSGWRANSIAVAQAELNEAARAWYEEYIRNSSKAETRVALCDAFAQFDTLCKRLEGTES